MNQTAGLLAALAGPVPDGAIGFDTDYKLTPDHIGQFAQAKYDYAIRYLTLGTVQDTSVDLDGTEAQNILDRGLGLMPVQRVRLPGWAPSADLGTYDGTNSRAHAYTVGFPAHVNVWLDLEGINVGTDPKDVIAYCNNWYDAVAAWGYIPGLYVGSCSILTGDQLYHELKFQHYWKSMSAVPTPLPRGFQLIQTAAQPYYGVPIDRDVAQTDHQGGQAQWLHI